MLVKLLTPVILSLGVFLTGFGTPTEKPAAKDCCAKQLVCCQDGGSACCVAAAIRDCCPDCPFCPECCAGCCEQARACCGVTKKAAVKVKAGSCCGDGKCCVAK